MQRLSRSFFERNTQVVAIELIGKIICLKQGSRMLSGRIVETEAYFGPDDPASHAFRGPTPRCKVMFGPAGHSYVYFTYGNHHCINFVTEEEGRAGAVLIRAVEPVEGIETMKKNRPTGIALEQLTNGPGKLTQAMGINLKHSCLDLTTSYLFVAEDKVKVPLQITVGTRIGITRAQDRLLRFSLATSRYVSR